MLAEPERTPYDVNFRLFGFPVRIHPLFWLGTALLGASWLDAGVELMKSKIRSGRLDRRTESVQLFGRLLSTRHRTAPIAGRGRITIPDAFREFLGVEPGGNVQIVGAAVCVEIWRPESWSQHIGEQMPGFRQLFDQLTE